MPISFDLHFTVIYASLHIVEEDFAAIPLTSSLSVYSNEQKLQTHLAYDWKVHISPYVGHLEGF